MKSKKSKRVVYDVPERNVFTVREARASFSELVKRASEGAEMIITSHGRQKAAVTGVRAGRPFVPDRRRLESMKPLKGVPAAEDLIRVDREGRG